MTTFWEIATHSVGHLFSLYCCLFVILVISHLGFERGVFHLISPVSVHCFLITFNKLVSDLDIHSVLFDLIVSMMKH